jgi:WD40 repeat protein
MAWRLAPTNEALSALQKIANASSDVARILSQHTIKQIDSMAFSPASGVPPLLATGGVDGSIMLWRIPEGTAAGPALTSDQIRINEIEFSGGGSYLLSRGDVQTPEEETSRQTIVLHDCDQERAVRGGADFLDRKSWDPDTEGALSPDGQLVAFLSFDEIAVWSAATNSVREKRVDGRGRLMGVHFAGNTRLVFVYSLEEEYPPHHKAGFWDLQKDEIRIGPGTQGSSAEAMNYEATFSEDGSRFAEWGINHGNLLLYEIQDDMRLQQLQFPGSVRMQDDQVFHIAFGAQGKRVAVGGEGKIAAWDLAEHKVLKDVRLRSPMGDPPVAMSPDGRWLATTEDGKVVIWDLDHQGAQMAASTLDVACSFAGKDARECIRRLCEKVSSSINEKDLSSVLGPSGYEELKQRAMAEPCAHP